MWFGCSSRVTSIAGKLWSKATTPRAKPIPRTEFGALAREGGACAGAASGQDASIKLGRSAPGTGAHENGPPNEAKAVMAPGGRPVWSTLRAGVGS